MEYKLADTLGKVTKQSEFAIGNDLVFLPEFEKSFNELFKDKVYTNIEIGYCELFSEPKLRYASTWAAKEAVYKAVKQLSCHRMSFKAIEITRDKPSGKPEANIEGQMDKYQISLSISHDGDYVWAVAIAKPLL